MHLIMSGGWLVFWIVIAYFAVRGVLASLYDFTSWVIRSLETTPLGCNASEGHRRRCEDRSGTNAPREQQAYARCVRTSSDAGEARRSFEGC